MTDDFIKFGSVIIAAILAGGKLSGRKSIFGETNFSIVQNSLLASFSASSSLRNLNLVMMSCTL